MINIFDVKSIKIDLKSTLEFNLCRKVATNLFIKIWSNMTNMIMTEYKIG